MLTGDSTLRNRKVGEESESNFKDIQANLLPALNSRSDALWPRRNAGVIRRGEFVNWVFAGGLPDVEIVIDAECAELIADAELTQMGVGEKLKEMVLDKLLGVRYQKRGHFSDILDYYVVTVLAAQYEAFKAGRDG